MIGLHTDASSDDERGNMYENKQNNVELGEGRVAAALLQYGTVLILSVTPL